MKQYKIIVFLIVFIIITKICFAQEISIRGGLNHSQYQNIVYGDVINAVGIKFNPGFVAGPVFELPVTNVFSFESGILLTSKGEKSSYDFPGSTVLNREKLYYAEIPVLCKVYVPVNKIKIFVLAGPYFAEALHGKRKNVIIENSVEEILAQHDIFWGDGFAEYDRFDSGLKFGIGLRYQKWQMGANYCLGLKNFRNTGDMVETRNRTVEFNLSYALIKLKSNKK